MREDDLKLTIVENEIEKRKRLDNLSRYNTGEKVHKNKLLFISVQRKTGGCLVAIEVEKLSAVRLRLFGLQEEYILTGKI